MERNKDSVVYTDNVIETKFGLQLVNLQFLKSNEKSEYSDTAYVFNIQAGLEFELNSETKTSKQRSAVYLYCINTNNQCIRITYFYNSYFYISLASSIAGISTIEYDHHRHQIINFLENIAAECCHDKIQVSVVSKVDLSRPGHIQNTRADPYRKKKLLKVTFTTVQDCQNLRRELTPRIQKNKKKVASFVSEAMQESGDIAIQDTFHNSATYSSKTFAGFRQMLQNYLDEDPFFLADNILEHDVPLVSRVCIDMNIRCGKWYHITIHPNEQPQIVACSEINQGITPALRYLAWDIEVTKEKLKFPSPYKDSISLVSFMCDKQGFLIVNRSVLSENIDDFEYTPRPEYPGIFHVVNLPNEKELILTFYDYIKKLSPHILVTYNGDNFDFEFLRIRGLYYGISMLMEIGFPYATRDGSVPLKIGKPTTTRTAMGLRQEYRGRYMLHMDCLRWVERDSYLPCGSRGLKEVTKAKLGYNPRELDPELMESFAIKQPKILAEYSVSDAVATYYLYEKYIHGFTLALASIIPVSPDDVLRKGSGTLCEDLLMAEAYKVNVLFPNKNVEILEKWKDDKLLLNETYVGGNVAQLNSGIFRCDIPENFCLNSKTFESFIQCIPDVVDYWFTYDEGNTIPRDKVSNLDKVIQQIQEGLQLYTKTSVIKEEPVIYHYDVAAMYPNIILSNRLQPTAIVNEESHCKYCPYYSERKECQRVLKWEWKGEYFPLSKAQIQLVRDQLSNERFTVHEHSQNESRYPVNRDTDSDSTSDSQNEVTQINTLVHEEKTNFKIKNEKKKFTQMISKSWNDLTEKQKYSHLVERLKLLSRKLVKKSKISVEEIRTATVCMRENPFYVETVRNFRDRRYLLKVKKKKAEDELRTCNDYESRQKSHRNILLYDSLQLAHKCILNSFYGYVMRKGSRWYSMEMAAVVTHTGAKIIQATHHILSDIGKPLELDTDGIWTLLPKRLPQSFRLEYTTADSDLPQYKTFNFICTLLNLKLFQMFSNPQYMKICNETGLFKKSTEHFIFFEVDGPYKAIVLPASEKEGMSLKKRYAVFDMRNRIVELKGFELKRRGELELLKIFQEEVFPKFLNGNTREEAYMSVSLVANRWLDFLQTRGQSADKLVEVFNLISESKFLSKPVSMQSTTKSMGITTAKRLTELLGDPTYINDKGIKCEYIVCANDQLDKTFRAVPIQLFEAPLEVQQLHLQRWLGIFPSATTDPRSFLDWSYYRQRLETAILKIIVIPALHQGVENPVPRVVPPEWIIRNISLTRSTQTRLSNFFTACPIQNQLPLKTPSPIRSTSTQPSSPPIETKEGKIEESLFMKTNERAKQITQECNPSSNPHEALLASWFNQRKNFWKKIRCNIKESKLQKDQLLNTMRQFFGSTLEETIQTFPLEIFYRYSLNSSQEFVEWFIIDIESDPLRLGLFYFYVVLRHIPYRVFRVPLLHLRQIIVNSVSPSFHLYEDGIYLEKLSSSSAYTLPRGFQEHHLYKLHMTEEKFRHHRESLRPTGHILSVYGKNRPLEFDLLCCYGDSVRLSYKNLEKEVKLKHSVPTPVLYGPEVLEQVHRESNSATTVLPKLQWIFIVVLHNGPVDNPTQVVIYVFRPPVVDPVTGIITTSGSTYTIVGSHSNDFKQMDNFQRKKHLSTIVMELKNKKCPSCFSMSIDISKQILVDWIFHPVMSYSNTLTAFKSFSDYIQKINNRSILNKEPPFISFLSTSLPSSLLGSWADSIKRSTISSPIFPLYVTKLYYGNNTIHRYNFFSDATKLATQNFIKNLYLVEWSTLVACTIQIPILKILHWTSSPHELQRNILDLMLARGLKANKLIPWDSDEFFPDLGTPLLRDRSISDFELPQTPTNFKDFVYPSTTWTVTFRLGLSGQFTTGTLFNLDKLAKLYNNPLRYAFLSDTLKSSTRYKNSVLYIPASQNLKTITNTPIDNTSPDDERFQHTSNIPGKTLIVLHRCLQLLDERIRIISSALPKNFKFSPYQGAITFLSMTTRRVQAWQDSPSSLFYDPSLQETISNWTQRYMQTLVQEIKKISDNCLTPLLISTSQLILSTPTISLHKAQRCLSILFSALKKDTMFSHLQPQSCIAYRGFLLFDSCTWMGLRLANKHKNISTGWENHFHSLLRPFPEPIQFFLQRVIEDIITLPLRSANVSPDEDFLNHEEEASKMRVVNSCAEQQIISCDSQNESATILGFAEIWFKKIQDLASIKNEWYNSSRRSIWEHHLHKKLQHKIRTLKKLSLVPYLCNNTKLSIHHKLSQETQQVNSWNKNNSYNRYIYSFPDCPGMFHLQKITHEKVMKFSGITGYDKRHQVVELVPSLTEDQLQLATARVFYALLQCHPTFWSLDNETKEMWITNITSSIRASADFKTLEYKSLYNPVIPITPISCNDCGQKSSPNIMTSLIENPETYAPSWNCFFCEATLDIKLVELSLIELFLTMVEAAQSQDILCNKCKRLQNTPYSTFCNCGGDYHARIHRIEFQLFWTTFRTLTDTYPLHLPHLYALIDQSYRYKCF